MDILKLRQYSSIYSVDCFAKEFKGMFDTSSLKRYQDWLSKILFRIDERERIPIKLEKLTPELYSIRHPRSKCNPRVVLAYMDSGKNIILLTAFKEKTASDYRLGIDRANGRIKQLKEDSSHGHKI